MSPTDTTLDKANLTNEFLLTCMSENLEHMRHVENELLTFMSIYTAIVVGGLASIYQGKMTFIIQLGMNIFLLLLSLFAFHLCERWNDVFDFHRARAEICYDLYCTKNRFPSHYDRDHPPLTSPNNSSLKLYPFEIPFSSHDHVYILSKPIHILSKEDKKTQPLIKNFLLVVLSALLLSLLHLFSFI